MTKANQNIRFSLKENNVPQWMLADKMGISEFTLVRKFRKELSEEEQNKILNIIKELKY